MPGRTIFDFDKPTRSADIRDTIETLHRQRKSLLDDIVDLNQKIRDTSDTKEKAELIDQRDGSIERYRYISGKLDAKLDAYDDAKMSEKNTSGLQSTIDTYETGGKIAAGLALAAVVMGIGYKVYQRKFSQAAKACSKSGISYRQKSICMLKYQIGAFEQEIKFLNASIQKCSKAKDPDKCKTKIHERIAKLTYKIKKSQAKIMQLEAKEKLKARESYEVELSLGLLAESKRCLNEIDPIVTPIVLGSIAATGAGLSAARLIAAKRKRKQCVEFASDIEDPEERKKAYVRCYQAGND